MKIALISISYDVNGTCHMITPLISYKNASDINFVLSKPSDIMAPAGMDGACNGSHAPAAPTPPASP